MAKLDWVDMVLDRWSMWVISGRKMGTTGAVHPMWRGTPPGGVREARVPIIEEECWRTDQAVRALPSDLAELVGLYYLRGSQVVRHKLGISSATLSQRLSDAHLRIAAWFQDNPAGPQPTAHRGPNY